MVTARRKPIATDSVGLALAHDSAALHVSGAATYIDDMREPEGLLHVVPGFAREGARGKIKSVDLDAVRSYPGVVAVFTASDIPGNNDCSPLDRRRSHPRRRCEIEFHSQVIFAVAAVTRDAARRAARLAKIEIAAEKPAVTVDDAVAMKTRDVLPPYEFRRRDVKSALKGAPNRFGETFLIGGQEHFYLEGQVSMAIPEEGGAMTVYTSTQHPTEVQHSDGQDARAFPMPWSPANAAAWAAPSVARKARRPNGRPSPSSPPITPAAPPSAGSTATKT